MSVDIQHFIPRPTWLKRIRQGLAEFPSVALLGARQVGKTTLARLLTAEWTGPTTWFDLEEYGARAALSATPNTILRQSEGLVVLDEVQRMPHLLEVLRPICDDPARRAVFLLLGSASPDLAQGASETLAGRIRLLDVAGLSLLETGPASQGKLWLRGGFPRAYLASSPAAWERWLESFTRTFIERDIPALAPRTSPEALNRFWRMTAHRHGQTWNASAVARSMDVRPGLANRYRNLLSGTFMVRVLPPWFENLGKRLVKSPKVYIRDGGVLHFLLGVADEHDLRVRPHYGASWEGFGIEQALIAHGQGQAYFYRTQRGAELDLLLLRRGCRWGFEFKCTDAPRTTKSMRVALKDLGLEHLWVVYPGKLKFPLARKITALPLRDVHELRFRPTA